MDAILRFRNGNKIEDFDLSENRPIHQGIFFAYPQPDGWKYQASEPIYANGKESLQGNIQIESVYVVDFDEEKAIYILEKVTGTSMIVEETDEFTVGRKENNGIVLNDRMVSGYHCRFYRKFDKWFVADLNSSNGTICNDRLIEETELKKEDTVKIGRYRFSIAGDKIRVDNADDRVVFHILARKESVSEIFQAKPYPWFSCAPRMVETLEQLYVRIESAPSIGEKPTMGMGGLALTPQLLALSLGMQALRFGLGKRKYSKQEKLRAEIYANYLADIEGQLQNHAEKQRKHEEKLHPSLFSCMSRVYGPSEKLWERHPGEKDFLSMRLGTGTVKAAAKIETPTLHLSLREEELDRVPEQLAEKYTNVEDVPISCSLVRDGNCGLTGQRPQVIAMARNMAAQIAALHNYEEVKIVALFPKHETDEWSWMRWLPHCLSPDRNIRFMVSGESGKDVLKSLEPIIRKRLESHDRWEFGQRKSNLPHFVFIVADQTLLRDSVIGTTLLKNQPDLGISGIFLGNSVSDFPHSVRNVVEINGNFDQICLTVDSEKKYINGKECLADLKEYDKFARKMAPIRLLGSERASQGLPGSIGYLEGMKIRNPERIDIGEFWNETACEKSLSVPIGVKSDGELFYFDIHEKYDGPHGLVAGATGSGKSQMAHTWIISMAMQFSPQNVNFVLVDFKGKSLIQPLKDLPHIAGTISNLDKDVSRGFYAMESELDRRQKILAEYECGDIIEYLKLRRINCDMPPLPYIILVVDEFAELKTQFPDFAKSMEHFYRGGRSLGMFVILMTQSPGGIVTDQMKNNAAFRWCLSVKSDSDSKELLGTADASSIRVPGRAFVKSNHTYELIQSFYVGKSYQKFHEKKASDTNQRVYAVSLTGARMEGSSVTKKESFTGKTELSVLISAICDYCKYHDIRSAEPMWQKELPEYLELFGLKGQGYVWDDFTGWTIRDFANGPVAVLGMVDDPGNQKQYPLCHEFWKMGHLAVYGMPVSGKTIFLQTMMISLCNKYTPEQVQIYMMDFGGFGLRSLEVFPHVGTAVGDDEPEEMSKLIELIQKELNRRKKIFRDVGAGSPSAYAEACGKPLPTILFMVDNLNQAGYQYPEFMNFVIQLAREGASYGIYLVCSFIGTAGVNYQLSQNIKRVVALRLAERSEYVSLVGRPNEYGTGDVTGRGFIRGENGPLLFQTAIAKAEYGDSKRTMYLRQTAAEMKKYWQGELPKSILKIPEILSYTENNLDGAPFVFGVNLSDGIPVRTDLKDLQSVLISDGVEEFGADGRNASTDMIRCMIRQLSVLPEKELVIYSPDPSAYGELSESGKILSKAQELKGIIEPLKNELRRRQGILRQHSDEKFVPILVVIDGLRECIQCADEEVIARLEVFIRLGKGLNFTVIAADTAGNVGKCRNEDSLLTATMRKGPVILLGGNLAVHQVVDTYELRKKHPKAMETEEGCLVQEGDGIFFRRMHEK